MRPLAATVIALALSFTLTPAARSAEPATRTDAKVSFHKQIRPILQANCYGCHQPAKAKGGYVMTDAQRLRAGGDSGDAAVAPGDPVKSALLEMITPKDGAAEMPKGKKALVAADIDLIRQWILQGAVDDTPANARARYDQDHPPVYTRPPVITSLDYSPDGKLLAIAGFHEVLLYKGDGSAVLARLVGLSERIQSVRFSPDGKQLAVTGGLPGRAGEVQVWDMDKRKLALSVPITYDTVYGVSWSPDGKKLAFGGGDNSVRAIDAKTGAQVLFSGAHNDWVIGTVFSSDGSHVVSVGRDRTAKLIEVANQRFVDNVTSITPGALKGGILAVARHPKRDEIVIGGADGVPKVYRMFRIVKRVIGDDSNLIRVLPAAAGRIGSITVSRDGKRIAVASALDGRGEVNVYSYEFDTKLPDKIKLIMMRRDRRRSEEDRAALERYSTEGVKRIFKTPFEGGGAYTVAFRPDGGAVAAAGSNGVVRLLDASTGALLKEFSPAPISAAGAAPSVTGEGDAPVAAAARSEERKPEPLPASAQIAGLEVTPKTIALTGRADYAQLLVSARLTTGEAIDVTRLATADFAQPLAFVSRAGLVQPRADGETTLRMRLGGRSIEVPVRVSGTGDPLRADFVHDVNPVMSKLGCNQGTCHGSAQGKNGFKLSLRGYDPIEDVRALTDDLASRRVNVASPDDSLMLLKPTGAVPHEGGRLFAPGDDYYAILRSWIAQGAVLDGKSPRVARIDVTPSNPGIERLGGRQQVRVVATYTDGKTRDVTREAFVESGNTEIATVDKTGVVTAVRRGEAAVLARFEGAYAATTLTVMGDRSGFVWADPPAFNKIDELAAEKWKRMKILPSALAGDDEFLRRVTLDLTGLPPTAAEIRAFVADQRPSRTKRDALVDKLIGSEAFLEHWTNKWADLLQVNRKFLGVEGAAAFRDWVHGELAKNTPYDQFVRKIVTASGSNRENPAASYYKILREPGAITENTTHLFLAVRFNCNKCHDHPFERWTQNQYYETAAFFARVGLRDDAASEGKRIGGTAVEGSKALYEVVYEKPTGEVTHLRTSAQLKPKFPFDVRHPEAESASRRERFAAWLTSPENPYFAKSYVNRLWGYLFGIGIIEPIDDIRAGNPASNPKLLDYLTKEFVAGGFDARKVMRLICTSRTYQLSVATNRWNQDDKVNYSHAIARRLPAEVVYDAVHRVTGAVSQLPGMPPGTRAASVPDSLVEAPGGFLATLGRPPRESACECERGNELRLGAVMSLAGGPTIAEAIADPKNDISKLVGSEPDDRKLVSELFLRILGREAKPNEVAASLADLQTLDEDQKKLAVAATQREQAIAAERARKAKEREATIAKTKAELEAYEKEVGAKIAEEEQKHAEAAAAAESELRTYEATLPAKVKAWEKKQRLAGDWVHLVPTELETTNNAKLTAETDLSVSASDDNGKGEYVFTTTTELQNITGVRLEVMNGRGKDGRFLLTGVELKAAPKDQALKAKPVELRKPLADVDDGGYALASVVDAKAKGKKGWSVMTGGGVTHWATFETKRPVGFKGGTVLTFTLRHDGEPGDATLGRFRISVTTTRAPIGLGLSDDLRAVLARESESAEDPQRYGQLLKYQRAIDADLQKRLRAFDQAKKPLAPDAKLKELREAYDKASKPLGEDARLAELRHDAEMSDKQLREKRLTVAQDIAWALINSPAFLFNH